MAKNIAFCADGTWNHPHSPALVSGADTNVYKLYKTLAVTSSQTTFYDDGVGSDGIEVWRLLGGAFGTGLFQKVKDGYTAVAHVYEEGDSIYLFGFSRGAYTARSLAGMIAICGLPTKNFDQHMVDTAFEAYRNRDQRKALLDSLADYHLFDAKITLLGVWDTVGALGIPGAVFGASSLVYGFLDTSLHPDVLHAYHAVSIDERRREFQPSLWTNVPAQGQTMEQVWFAGVHSDVGGGYAENGLSDITLSWMLGKAIENHIETIPAAASPYLNLDPKHSLDTIHESWNVLWGFPERRSVPAGSVLSNSVAIRLGGEVNYHPPNLSLDGFGRPEGYGAEAVVATPKTMTAGAGPNAGG